jgi:hypothetical protein
MTFIHHFKPKTGKEIPFIILISFLATFTISRFVVNFFPDLFLNIRHTHIHHFSYGIILLSLSNLLLLTLPHNEKNQLKLAILSGVALGLAFDEFGMWIDLEENSYWSRQNYDAIMLISLILLNIIYFAGFWKKWGLRLGKFLRIISS